MCKVTQLIKLSVLWCLQGWGEGKWEFFNEHRVSVLQEDILEICCTTWIYVTLRIRHLEMLAAAAAAKLLQSCPPLCNPIGSSPSGSPVPGILQARTLEWVAISFSNAWKWKVKVKSLSRAQLLVTPWTAAYQAPPSMGFSRHEYWTGLPLPSPRNA